MNKTSPYAKMYLVSPAVYEKLLKCIDEGDKSVTEALNEPMPGPGEDKRPSEQIVEQIHLDELIPKKKKKITPEMLSAALADVQSTIPQPTQHTLPTIPEEDEDVLMQDQPPPMILNDPPTDVPMIPVPPPITFEELPASSPVQPAQLALPAQPAQLALPAPPKPILRPPKLKAPTPRLALPMPVQAPIVQPIQSNIPIQPQFTTNQPRLIMPDIMVNPKPAVPPKCITTRRGTICNTSTMPTLRSTNRNPGERYFCTMCSRSYSRKYDLKKHLLLKHQVMPEQGYQRWGISDPEPDVDDPNVQGVKRKRHVAGIKNRNPTKVSKTSSDTTQQQSGSGHFPSWN